MPNYQNALNNCRVPQQIEHLKQIFHVGIKTVDAYRVVKRCIKLKNNVLFVKTADKKLELDLKNFDKIFVLGAGKAAAKMAVAMEDILSNKITLGAVVVKYGHTEPLKHIRLIEAAHPVPDESCLRASKTLKEIAQKADEKTVVFNLISGGGSSLLTYPLDYWAENESFRVSLDDVKTLTQVLLECGASIHEINCLRKHVSSIKGGRFLGFIYPATSVSLILSDVTGDRLDTIASGFTTFDATTFADACCVIKKYNLKDKVPESVLRVIHLGVKGMLPETPKSGNLVLSKNYNVLIGSNLTALMGAKRKAEAFGYEVKILSSQVFGEAKEVAKVFLAIAKDIKRCDLLAHKPACILSGGETCVSVKGKGKGGRNMEMALSFLLEMKQNRLDAGNIYALCASTDGNDGPTDASGAFVFEELLDICGSMGLKLQDYLKNNDSYTFFEKIGFLYKTGPTKTNVSDMIILIVL